MNFLTQIDYNVFLAFNSLAGHTNLLDKLYIFLANDLVYVEVILLALFWFARKNRPQARKGLFVTFVSFVLARGILAEVIRAIVPRNRPFISHQVTELVVKGNEASFPSGHATAMFAIAMGIYYYDRRLGKLLFGLAILTSLSRIVVGVHYPSDIISGAILGMVTAWGIEKAMAKKEWVSRVSIFLSKISDRVLPFTKLK